MFIEVLIGLGLLVFLLWKFLLSSKEEHLECDKSEHSQNSSSIYYDKEESVQNLVNKFDSISKKQIVDNEIIKTQPYKKSLKIPEEIFNIISHEKDDLITPSILLKQRRERLLSEQLTKRESPPKEKLAEFLEKTILSDDKIQSIIQNLSLDKSEILIHEEPAKILYPTTKDIQYFVKKEEYVLSEKAVEQQACIDDISNIINRFNTINSCGQDQNNLEEKPLLKQIQRQPGFPSGVNFGSVIGELKNKTKNGGLKPVFKKFDSLDVQAGFFLY